MKRLLVAVLPLILLLAWGSPPVPAADVPGDANGDGTVDILDLAQVGFHYGWAEVWTTYSNPNDVTSIAFDGNQVWLGTYGGVSVFGPGLPEGPPRPQPLIVTRWPQP